MCGQRQVLQPVAIEISDVDLCKVEGKSRVHSRTRQVWHRLYAEQSTRIRPVPGPARLVMTVPPSWPQPCRKRHTQRRPGGNAMAAAEVRARNGFARRGSPGHRDARSRGPARQNSWVEGVELAMSAKRLAEMGHKRRVRA